MKNFNILFVIALFLAAPALSQTQILQERFGSIRWTSAPSGYPGYTSDAVFGGDTLHSFPIGNSGSNTVASGEGAGLMGNRTEPPNEEFVMQCNTSEYISVRLSFGIRHNSSGWDTCTLTRNYIRLEYSTGSVNLDRHG